MLKTFKVEMDPTEDQIKYFNQTMGACRWIYNHFIKVNDAIHDLYKGGYLKPGQKHYLGYVEFNKYISKLKQTPGYKWLQDCSVVATKAAAGNADTAFKNYFKKQCNHPRLKIKNKTEVGIYLGEPKAHIAIKSDKVKIPKIGWVKIKEKNYIPTSGDLRFGTITKRAGRYYVSYVFDVEDKTQNTNKTEPLGIDLGIRDYAITSDPNIHYKNINKSKIVNKLEKRLKRDHRRVSRRQLNFNKRLMEAGGQYVTRKNLDKAILRLQRTYNRLHNIRNDYQNKIVIDLVKRNPSYISIEDLDVTKMLNNKYISKQIKDAGFYNFRIKLTHKCQEYGVELRIVDRTFPSTKTCSCCGNVKPKFNLSQKTYICKKCGLVINRDLNAAINLRDTNNYTLAF